VVVTRTYGVLLFAAWLVHCGGKSHPPTSGAPASGTGGGANAGSPGGDTSGGTSGSSGSSGSGAGGVNQRAGSSGSGGSMSGGTSGGMTSTGGAGGVPNAGRHDGGGAPAAGEGGAPAAGEGGAPSEPVGDGFACERDMCVPGEVCVNCDFFGNAYPLICAPDPALDQAGYDARVEEAGCLAVNPGFECDGPEDCAPGERCAAADGLPYLMGACVSEPPCDAPYECVICRSDDDCPGTSSCTDERQGVYGSRQFCAD
jgi:hypothetical protein